MSSIYCSIASVIFGSLFTAFSVGNAMVCRLFLCGSFFHANTCHFFFLVLFLSTIGLYLHILFTFNRRKCDGRCTSLCQSQKIRGCRCTILHVSNLKFSATTSVNLLPKMVRLCVWRPSLRANNSPKRFIRAMMVHHALLPDVWSLRSHNCFFQSRPIGPFVPAFLTRHAAQTMCRLIAPNFTCL